MPRGPRRIDDGGYKVGDRVRSRLGEEYEITAMKPQTIHIKHADGSSASMARKDIIGSPKWSKVE